LDDLSIVEIPPEYRDFALRKRREFIVELSKSASMVVVLAFAIPWWNGNLTSCLIATLIEKIGFVILFNITYVAVISKSA